MHCYRRGEEPPACLEIVELGIDVDVHVCECTNKITNMSRTIHAYVQANNLVIASSANLSKSACVRACFLKDKYANCLNLTGALHEDDYSMQGIHECLGRGRNHCKKA